MMAIRTSVLQELLRSERWSRRLESAETMEQVQAVLEAFCRRNKREVVYLADGNRRIERMPLATA